MNNLVIPEGDVLDVAMIAAIMGNTALTQAYDDNNPDIGYVATTEMVAKWAIEFHNKTKRMSGEDWEMAHTEPEKYDLDPRGCCWDDHVIFFAENKAKEWLSSQ